MDVTPSTYQKNAQNQDHQAIIIASQYTTATWISSCLMSTKLFTVSCKQIAPGQIDFRKLVLNVSFPTTIGNCRTVPASLSPTVRFM